MPIATITSKGQITIPARMRKVLRLAAGSKLVFEEQPNGDFVVRKQTGDIRDLKGFLKAKPGFAPTLEEIEDGIAEGAVERHARAR